MGKEMFTEWNYIDEVGRKKVHLKRLAITQSDTQQSTYVYQYRTLNSFWAIIESDSFWATNARFSNDLEEQNLGCEKIMELLGSKEVKEADLLGDCYIICFCNEDDKLSQWRGYANEGVSIGFDFNNIRPFYIQEQDGKTYHKYYNSCYKVMYIDKQTKVIEFADVFDLSTTRDTINANYIKECAGDIIPYVKHKGFHEEAESRLVFSNNIMNMSKCIRYKESGKIKVPYIVVKMGEDEAQKINNCIIRVNGSRIYSKKVKELLERELGKSVKIIICGKIESGPLDDESCYGCSLRRVYQDEADKNRKKCRYACAGKAISYIEERNEIYISDCRQQEEIFEKVYNALQHDAELAETKIWCEGHLPVRSITVSSMRGADEVVENIKHYCKNHYWLKSVDVKRSKIPYRSQLV